MIGYAIAALKKDKVIVGLRVITLGDSVVKDITLKAAKILYIKSKDMLYNLDGLTQTEIQKLPLFDVSTAKLSKDIWTVMLNIGRQYLISNAKGETFSVALEEAKRFKYTNSVYESGTLVGKFVIEDTGEHQEDAWLLFDHPIDIVNGQIYIKNSDTGPVLEMPSVVTGIKQNCWKNAGEFECVRLGVNLGNIGQGDLDGLHTKVLIVPVGINRLNAFAFSNCTAEKVVIEGNTLPTFGIFNNANVTEVYVNNVLISKYRTIITPGMKVKGLSELQC